MASEPGPERLVCDTSFVGHVGALRMKPERYAHWPVKELERIENAVLAISVVTLAEARFGYLNAGWGGTKIAQEEGRLASFLQVPLDLPDLDEWARLRDQAKRHGIAIGDNDLWIAATASTRGLALVTCDEDQHRLERHLPVAVIYLPPPS